MDNNYLNNSKTENYTVSQMLNMIENAKSASLKKFDRLKRHNQEI